MLDAVTRLNVPLEGPSRSRVSWARIGLMVILVLATAIPMPVLAQDGVVVQGRVFQFGSRVVIPNARVDVGRPLMVEIALHDKFKPITLTGEVIWTDSERVTDRAGCAAGIRFTRLHEIDRNRIDSFLHKSLKRR